MISEPSAKQATLARYTGRRPWRSPRLASSAVLDSEHRMKTTINSPASRWSMAKASRSAGIAGAITAVSSAAMNTPMNSAGIRRRGGRAWVGKGGTDMRMPQQPGRKSAQVRSEGKREILGARVVSPAAVGLARGEAVAGFEALG